MLTLLIAVPALRAFALLPEFRCRIAVPIRLNARKRLYFMLSPEVSGVQDLLKPR
jgi:hypothetical protein